MELALVRHAQPDSRDAGLTPAGRQQAHALADRLHHEWWDALYSAPERCAVDTAGILADRLGLEPRSDEGLASDNRNAVDSLDALIAAHPGQRVVIVTHGSVINAFVGDVLGASRPVVPHPAHTGVTRVLAARSGRRELRCLNDSSHLRLPWRAPVDRSSV